MESKQHATKEPMITEEIKEKIKNTCRQVKTKTQQSKMYGRQQKQF